MFWIQAGRDLRTNMHRRTPCCACAPRELYMYVDQMVDRTF